MAGVSEFELNSVCDTIPAAAFTPPSQEELRLFSQAVSRAVQQGILDFRLRQVRESDLIPWDPTTRIFDCDLTIKKEHPFTAQVASSYECTGSGHGQDLVQGFCHAFSEAMERTSASLGGQRNLRPSDSMVYSLLHKDWLDIGLNPLVNSASNPHYSGSGEAFNVNGAQALRGAFCEVLERAAICQALEEDSSVTFLDITSYAKESFPIAQACSHYWTVNNYDFRLLALEMGFKVWVVLAMAVAEGSTCLIQGVRGSAADFTLRYAVQQAISELGRYYLYGFPSNLTRETLAARIARPLNRLDQERLSLFRDATPLKALLDRKHDDLSREAVDALTQSYGPVQAMQQILDRGQDIWIVPLCDGVFGIPGRGYKVICPGFPQEPRFYRKAFPLEKSSQKV